MARRSRSSDPDAHECRRRAALRGRLDKARRVSQRLPPRDDRQLGDAADRNVSSARSGIDPGHSGSWPKLHVSDYPAIRNAAWQLLKAGPCSGSSRGEFRPAWLSTNIRTVRFPQHAIVYYAAQALPSLCMLGDPMQAIFRLAVWQRAGRLGTSMYARISRWREYSRHRGVGRTPGLTEDSAAGCSICAGRSRAPECRLI